MGKKDDIGVGDIRRALGAKRVVKLDARPSQGPLDLLNLREQFLRQLRSTGGRPTNPEWEISRSVRFKAAQWKRLERLADAFGAPGRRISAGQLASALMDQGIQNLARSAGDTITSTGFKMKEPPLVLQGAASLRHKRVPIVDDEKTGADS